MAHRAKVDAMITFLTCVVTLDHGGTTRPMTVKQCKIAFRRLASQVHPDKGGSHDQERAIAAFQVVSRAWDIVKAFARWNSDEGDTMDPELEVEDHVFFSVEETDWEVDLRMSDEELATDDAYYANLAKPMDQREKESDEEALGVEEDEEEEDARAEEEQPAEAARAEESAEEARVEEEVSAEEEEEEEEEEDASPPAKKTKLSNMTPDEKKAHQKELKRLRNIRYKAKQKYEQQADLAREHLEESRWLPLPLADVTKPVLGLEFSERWRAHQHGRAVAATLQLRKIYVTLKRDRVVVKCGICSGRLVYTRAASGIYKLAAIPDHMDDCYGSQETPLYKAKHVARLCSDLYAENPNVRNNTIREHIKATRIFVNLPTSKTFLCEVKKEVVSGYAERREVEMAALPELAAFPELAALFTDLGHFVRVKTISGDEMKKTRIKAAEFTFKQLQKAKKILPTAKFNKDVVEVPSDRRTW